MSWSDQDIDKLFQQAKQPEIPPFEESFWSEMEAMLPEQKRKKAAIWWWTGGAAVVAVLLTIGLTATLSGSDVTKQPVSSQMNTQDQSSVATSNPKMAAEKTEFSSGNTIEVPANQTTINPFYKRNTVSSGGKFGGLDEKTTITQNTAVETKAPSAIINPTVAEYPIVDDLPPIDPFYRAPGVQLRTPNALTYKPARFYVQASAGLGLSSRKNVPQGADYLHCYSIGGGLFKKMDNVVLTFGIQGRVDFVRNIRYTYFPDGTATKRIDADYRQLYSVELPASIGLQNGRNSFAITVNAGFQTGVFGELKETNNEVVVRSENTFVHVDKKATTLTMELGCSYLRTIAPDWYLGAGVNADIIEPFNGTSYAGEQRLLPLNAQIVLRRTF